MPVLSKELKPSDKVMRQIAGVQRVGYEVVNICYLNLAITVEAAAVG